MKNTLYIISLILLAISIFLIIEFPESNRLNLIAGVITMFGFSLNVVAFLSKKTVNKNVLIFSLKYAYLLIKTCSRFITNISIFLK